MNFAHCHYTRCNIDEHPFVLFGHLLYFCPMVAAIWTPIIAFGGCVSQDLLFRAPCLATCWELEQYSPEHHGAWTGGDDGYPRPGCPLQNSLSWVGPHCGWASPDIWEMVIVIGAIPVYVSWELCYDHTVPDGWAAYSGLMLCTCSHGKNFMALGFQSEWPCLQDRAMARTLEMMLSGTAFLQCTCGGWDFV